jgi:hypothetical protein
MQILVLILTELVNIGVENLSSKEDLGGDHGVLVWEEKLCVEETAFVGSLARSSDLHEEVAGVVLAGLRVDTDN